MTRRFFDAKKMQMVTVHPAGAQDGYCRGDI